MSEGADSVVEAIRDLTRVTLAVHGDFPTRSHAIRSLNDMGIPGPRIALIMNMKSGDVASVIAKGQKKEKKEADAEG